VRSGSIALFATIVPSIKSTALAKHTATELLALPKTGKSTGPEHRVVLYSMLGALSPSDSASADIVATLPGLLVKETHEPAIAILAPALTSHMVYTLSSGQPTQGDVIAKEMNNAKPAIRRAFSVVAGEVIWQLGNISNDATSAFVKVVLPALENALKTVSANPGGAPAGPLEAYVAVAIMLGPLTKSGTNSPAITSNAVLSSLSSTAKPSFLVLDRVYQKANSPDEEIWLLRASEAMFSHVHVQLQKSEELRSVKLLHGTVH
jgi:hypothetical protein